MNTRLVDILANYNKVKAVLSKLTPVRASLVISLVLNMLVSPFSAQQSYSADWPVITSASIDNPNPTVGEVIKWTVTIDCFDTGLREINVSYQDPLGGIQSAGIGNAINSKARPTEGDFTVPLKITEQAPNGNYKVLSVGVLCVGLGEGRYENGGFKGSLNALDFKVVGNTKFSQDTAPRIDSLRLISANTVSKGERVIVGAKISKLGTLEGGFIILEGPDDAKADCKDSYQSTQQNNFEWDLTFLCTVTGNWTLGVWKIGSISISGRAGLNIDKIDYNAYPFNSTDQAARILRLSQSSSTPSESFPNLLPQSNSILSSVEINVVELSPSAAAKVAAAAKLQQEAVSKIQALPLLSTSKLISAIVRKFGKTNSTLLATAECWRDLENSSKYGATAEIQAQVGQTWNSLDSDVRWIQGNQTPNCPKGYGPLLSAPVISNQSSFQFRIKNKDSDQELFTKAVKVSDESYPRANIEVLAMALLDFSDLESIKKEQEVEAKAAIDLKAKQGAEAKAKADAAGKVLPSPKKTTVTCVKGKLTKKVTAIKPVCPKGYKKK